MLSSNGSSSSSRGNQKVRHRCGVTCVGSLQCVEGQPEPVGPEQAGSAGCWSSCQSPLCTCTHTKTLKNALRSSENLDRMILVFVSSTKMQTPFTIQT